MAQTASMLAIGDELLSGRTKDKNIAHLADVMTMAGIDLKEVRIVGDEPEEIVAAVNALRARYDYVFTSGGIGPTHDDMTADAIAAAFEAPIGYHPQAYALMAKHYEARGMEFTEARKRMARTPEGASLIDNPVSVAPGFHIGNVYVLAGVPAVFQAMLEKIVAGLPQGPVVLSAAVECPFGEGDIGGPLGEIQKRHPDVVIGSYPKFDGARYSTELVVRSRDGEALSRARSEVEAMLADLAASRST
ncbi:molybdenum cofactor synthesis domain-containing protein [Aureimonas altamirensis DSM 21988]|uniref:Molybdopterin binding domain n=2 Tax=Aureimonas altamirensis TaxID=370622 RepID=A0A0P0YXJ5_9HYPH|nr:competence/damage-inducible protein A [Aureimonas altamirensis]BAT26288.1 molybdopterin binding domain [Aureimonas altamirensis]SHJ43245.1 molybdenum cofactor synthesis domain-containing protein [Aureimonas altamirensis DSM 21988]